MGRFHSKAGKILKTFISKKGNEVTIRLVQPDDLHALLRYINILSKEDTFIRKSGEHMTLINELEYLTDVMLEMKRGNKIKICSLINNKIIGVADVTRESFRSKHVGTLGISVREEFREEGIGSAMMDALIDESRRIKLISLVLLVYEPNERAKHVYTKKGFIQVGCIPEKAVYHGAFVDEIIMYKKL